MRKIPKLNIITFHYNGDQNRFEKFLSNMAADYLNSDNVPEYTPKDFGDSTLQKEKIQLSIMPNFRETPPEPGSGRSRKIYRNAG